jgi:hypothetical protein
MPLNPYHFSVLLPSPPAVATPSHFGSINRLFFSLNGLSRVASIRSLLQAVNANVSDAG